MKSFATTFLAILSISGICSAHINNHSLTVSGLNILNGGVPMRGFYALYGSTPQNRAEIEATLDAMKNSYGLKVFTIDVAWQNMESQRGQYYFAPMTDLILQVASEKNRAVNLNLSAHNTPAWVYQQGIDVHMKDAAGANANG